jgi:peptidoglycan/xylan/chitin deacetylase (PgdA/CDA1 family)/LysM repeat protein
MKRILAFALVMLNSQLTHALCDNYYFSLDFGGEIGSGMEMVKYFEDNNVPFTLFLVGKTYLTPGGQKVCEEIRKKPKLKLIIGNHTIGHKGFRPSDNKEYISEEILGNEKFMNECDSNRFAKVFRYPEGSSNKYAEEVLLENGYSGGFGHFFKKQFPQTGNTQTSIGWTADSRDWVKETSASPWATADYFNKNQKLLSLDEPTRNSLMKFLKGENNPFYQQLKDYLGQSYNNTYPDLPYSYVEGHHGPSVDAIVRKILNDQGVTDQNEKTHCFPLLHFGGKNTFAALQIIIPKLKDKNFLSLTEEQALTTLVGELISVKESIEEYKPKTCSDQQPFEEAQSIYVVQKGDTIYQIAKKYGCTPDIIKTVNHLSADFGINIGQKLIIPNECSSLEIQHQHDRYNDTHIISEIKSTQNRKPNKVESIMEGSERYCRIYCNQNLPQSCSLRISEQECSRKSDEEICQKRPDGIYGCK